MPAGPEKLLFQLFVIFVAAKIVGEVFERLRLPAVVGEIVAGALFGPYALGLIHPTDTIQSIAEIGAIFVLFHAGLETSPQDLVRVGRKSLLVAVSGVIVPFVLGFSYMKIRGDSTTEATFVGAAMVATSVGITARVLGVLLDPAKLTERQFELGNQPHAVIGLVERNLGCRARAECDSRDCGQGSRECSH